MAIILYNQELLELMKQFYVLTGIRPVLFDDNYNEIISYPMGSTSFCSYMRSVPEFDTLCRHSDRESFRQCRKTKSLTVYHCHAGLIEATAPLMDEKGIIIGYVMFGQITDNKNKNQLVDSLCEMCSNYTTDSSIREKAQKIKYKSNKQILAAAKILDACTSYILHRELVKPAKKQLLERIDKYIDEHLNEKITVDILCNEFSISRTRLYELMGKQISGGIAAFIKQKRLTAAKDLLKNTDIPISEVAYATGFDDYSYFLRVFKKQYNISPRKMRNSGEA